MDFVDVKSFKGTEELMRIAICDDNASVIESVRGAVLQCNNKDFSMNIQEFFSGENLLEAFRQGMNFDIIFIDIQMDKMDGIETAERIKSLQKDVILIFLTGYSNYVKEAFRLQAFQYLTKPVEHEEITREMLRAMEQYKQNHSQYKIEGCNYTALLEIQSILYLEVGNHMLTIYTEKHDYKIKGKLGEEENKLKKFNFIRCHQGYLVNMSWIQAVEEDSMLLNNGIRIPVSRRLRKGVMQDFTNFIIGKCI